MITGYNTDVEHKGVVYHVQTEDKGLNTPVILSLVYTGGAILASKRSPYDDLIASGFDEAVLTERLQRQHKLICAAVHSGRIDDLKRLSQRDQEITEAATQVASSTEARVPGEQESPPRVVPILPPESGEGELDRRDRFSIADADEADGALQVRLINEEPLRAGESVTLRIQVARNTGSQWEPVPRASVTLKTLGSHFQSAATFSTTDSAGRSLISLVLPTFSSGRAAILIRAEVEGESAELRRIVERA